jgi:salicylate hydroxylase
MSAVKRCIATTDFGHMQNQPVTIVGGGIGGLTVALALARHGARVVLHERAAEFTDIGAGVQITPNGAAVLAALGLNAALDRVAVVAQAVCPVDAVSGRRVARFDLSTLKGQPYRFIHRADLIEVLARACAKSGVDLRLGSAFVPELPHDGLLIGADGLHSALRPILNGPEEPFFTGQVAWRAVVQADSPPEARIWMAPGRHVVTYPLRGGMLNIVAVREQTDWAAEGWSHADDPATLRAVFADTCPELQGLLGQVTETRKWGLFRHEVAGVWHGDGIALLGDAAHPTLPFLAQGANLAIEDAWVLASCLDRGLGLPAYQVLRRARVIRAVEAANANARNYHLAGVRRVVAHAGLRAVGAVAPGAFLRRMDWLYGRDVTRDWGTLLRPSGDGA